MNVRKEKRLKAAIIGLITLIVIILLLHVCKEILIPRIIEMHR